MIVFRPQHLEPLFLRGWILLVLLSAFVLGCRDGEIVVDLESPEATAQSFGRLLCQERLDRVDAILAHLEGALITLEKKRSLLADTSRVDQSLSRLEAFSSLLVSEAPSLRRCEVVLTDIDRVEGDLKVHVAMKLRYKDWAVDEQGDLGLETREEPIVLTLVKLEKEWKISASTLEPGLPGGPLRSLLD